MNFQKNALAAALMLATSTVCAADDLNALRQQLQDLKQTYQTQIDALEQRLQAAEQTAQQAKSQVAELQSNAPETKPAKAAEKSNFNPDVSLILEGRYAAFQNDPHEYHLAGFQTAGEAGPGEEGFTLGHSELIFSANVDDKFYGQLITALHSHDGETEVEIEEAFIQTLGLGNGLTAKAGRFFSSLGYLNTQHPHAWDFADAPLIYRGLFGDQYNDDGVQLTWLAPTAQYVEVGGELLRGGRFPASASTDIGAYTLFAKTGGDVGASHSWLAGVSYWAAPDVAERTSEFGHVHEHEGEDDVLHLPSFSGDSRIWSAGVTWKWAPSGNAKNRNAKLQLEYFERREDGEIAMLHRDPAPVSSYDGTQRGFYLQGVYQFMPQWRVGARYDWLNSDASGENMELLEHAGLLNESHDPHRYSLMLDWSNSEFSRFRLQFNRDQSTAEADNQVFLQYIHSIGAHGAHSF